jgi:hypothetical protein
VKLDLMQPLLRRAWVLRRGDEVLGTLRTSLFRRGGEADVAGLRLEIEREGGVRAAYRIRDATTQEERALFAPQGGRYVLELGDLSAEWRRLDWRGGYGFVDPDGRPIVQAKIASGIARTSGEVEVTDDLPEEDAVIAALMAAFLLIRKAEATASAAASGAGVG